MAQVEGPGAAGDADGDGKTFGRLNPIRRRIAAHNKLDAGHTQVASSLAAESRLAA